MVRTFVNVTKYPQYNNNKKKNEVMSFSGKWMELEVITVREKSQFHKHRYDLFPLICGRKVEKNHNKTNQGFRS
jgi:hypothetical protein